MTPQQYDALPSEIKAILATFNEDADHYTECVRIARELKLKGYMCDFGLDGVIEVWKVIDHKEVIK